MNDAHGSDRAVDGCENCTFAVEGGQHVPRMAALEGGIGQTGLKK